jgi:hypothetical protein
MLTKLCLHYFRGNISGFRLDNEHLVKLPTPSPPSIVAIDDEKKKKKKKKEKHKKRKRSSSSSDNDSDDDSEHVAANEEILLEQKSSQKKIKKNKKERKLDPGEEKQNQKTSREHENKSSPPRATTTTAAAPTTTRAAPAPAGGNENLAWRASLQRNDVKNGFFSSAENEIIRQGVISWAQARNLSTEDFSWIFSGVGHRSSDVRGLWKHVALGLPQRHIKSVAHAGNRIFHPFAGPTAWTPELDEELRSHVAELGNKWSVIGTRMRRTRENVRFRYRLLTSAVANTTQNKGQWTIDEEEKLKNAVSEFLQARKQAEEEADDAMEIPLVLKMPTTTDGNNNSDVDGDNGGGASSPTPASPCTSEQKIDNRRLIDNIDWGAIAQKVETRTADQCVKKWYDQISPSMIVRGDWGIGDDRRMLKALWRAGNIAEYEVEWGRLVPQRTSQQAKRRWRLMVKGVPEYKEKEFGEAVEYLVNKHIPHMKEKEPRGGRTTDG